MKSVMMGGGGSKMVQNFETSFMDDPFYERVASHFFPISCNLFFTHKRSHLRRHVATSNFSMSDFTPRNILNRSYLGCNQGNICYSIGKLKLYVLIQL